MKKKTHLPRSLTTHLFLYYLLTYLPIFLPTYLLNYLLTYLPTYLQVWIVWQCFIFGGGGLLVTYSVLLLTFLSLIFFFFFSVSFQSIPLGLQKVPCIAQFSSSVLFCTREEKRREEERREERRREERFALGFALLVSSNWSALILRFENQHSAFFPFACSKKKKGSKGNSLGLCLCFCLKTARGWGWREGVLFCFVLFCFGLVWFGLVFVNVNVWEEGEGTTVKRTWVSLFLQVLRTFMFWVHFFCIFRSTQNSHAHENGVLFRVSYL